MRSVLVLIAIGAIVLPAWAVSTYPRAPIAEKVAFDRLQRMAEDSCKCARTKDSTSAKAECWRPFEARSGVRHDRVGFTACYPLSTRRACAAGDRDCFVVRYDIVGGHGLGFCTKAEATAAEALWASIATGSGDDAEDRADAAIQELARRYARGSAADPQPSQGCVGSE